MVAKRWLELVPLLERAVAAAPGGSGLHGVAVLSPAGEPVGTAGALAEYEVRALAALVSRHGPPDVLRTLFGGELASAVFEDRPVFLGIAGRCVFVIAVAGEDVARARAGEDVARARAGEDVARVFAGEDVARAREAASDLRDEIERLIGDSRARLGAGWVPPSPGSSGSSSPAEAFAWPSRPRGRGGRGGRDGRDGRDGSN